MRQIVYEKYVFCMGCNHFFFNTTHLRSILLGFLKQPKDVNVSVWQFCHANVLLFTFCCLHHQCVLFCCRPKYPHLLSIVSLQLRELWCQREIWPLLFLFSSRLIFYLYMWHSIVNMYLTTKVRMLSLSWYVLQTCQVEWLTSHSLPQSSTQIWGELRCPGQTCSPVVTTWRKWLRGWFAPTPRWVSTHHPSGSTHRHCGQRHKSQFGWTLGPSQCLWTISWISVQVAMYG